jgi:hypothetical protein
MPLFGGPECVRRLPRTLPLEWGYRRLVLRFLIYGNMPWVILCAAFELPPPFRVPLLIAFAITIVFYWIAGFYWIVFGGGAEELAAHPGILRGSPRDPSTIKMQLSIILSLILVGEILVVSYLVSVAVPPILRCTPDGSPVWLTAGRALRRTARPSSAIPAFSALRGLSPSARARSTNAGDPVGGSKARTPAAQRSLVRLPRNGESRGFGPGS